jgi:hypothetical protein
LSNEHRKLEINKEYTNIIDYITTHPDTYTNLDQNIHEAINNIHKGMGRIDKILYSSYIGAKFYGHDIKVMEIDHLGSLE